MSTACCGLRHTLNSRRGGIAVALVIALVVLQLVVVSMVVSGVRDHALSASRIESLRTQYAADSGLDMSLRELAVGVDEDGDGTIGSVSGDGLSSTGPQLLGARISTELLPTSAVAGEIVVNARSTQAGRAVRARYVKPATQGSGGGTGLAAEFFSLGVAPTSLANVNWGDAPAATGPVPYLCFLSVSDASNPFWNSGPSTRYGVRLRGFIDVPQDGLWTFRLGSDEGSRLIIDGVLTIDHDGLHSFATRDGSVTLSAGSHALEVLYFENASNHGLSLAWQGPGVPSMTVVPPSALSLDAAPSPEFPPIAVSDFVYIWGENTANASYIDGFDASAGAYGGGNVLTDALLLATNATGSQKVQMSSLAQIRGRLQIGPGGNTSTAIALWGGSQITGGSSARSTSAGIHRSIDPFIDLPSNEGSKTYTSSFVIASDRTLQDLSIWGSSTVVTIVGNVVIRCAGSFNTGDQVRIELAAGATLTLFVGGGFNIYSQALMNCNTQDPSRCWVFMTGTAQAFQMTDRSKFVGHVRNPRGPMTLWGSYAPGAEFFGTFHGVSLTMGDQARFHADVSLLDPGSSGGAGAGAAGSVNVTSWVLEP